MPIAHLGSHRPGEGPPSPREAQAYAIFIAGNQDMGFCRQYKEIDPDGAPFEERLRPILQTVWGILTKELGENLPSFDAPELDFPPEVIPYLAWARSVQSFPTFRHNWFLLQTPALAQAILEWDHWRLELQAYLQTKNLDFNAAV